jgi:MinD-like ATPase involved in chromosome partitioning or flagellar assembly
MSAMDELMAMAGGESSSQGPPARKRTRKAKGLTGTTPTSVVAGTRVAAAVPDDASVPTTAIPASVRHCWPGRLLSDDGGSGDGSVDADPGAIIDATTAPPEATQRTAPLLPSVEEPGWPSVSLRRHTPSPVVPWHIRAHRRFRELTQPGRLEAEADAAIAALLARPALTDGCKTIAILGAKGGAGKSTTALALGLALGTFDAARPVVMEVNPDLGNVRQLLPGANPRTVQDLLEGLVAAERGGVNRVQGYLTMWGRMGVLTAPQRPDEMARLSPRDYARALRLLKLYFGTVILDCGTSFTNRLQQWAIQTADHLILVTQPEEAPLLTTLAAIDYLASTAYAEDYRGVFREVADAAGPEWAGARGSRARRDMTLVVNGVGFAGRRDPVDPDRIRAAASGLNAVLDVPYSAELRRRINDGVLTPEALPAGYRRAIKGGLAAVLGRLVEG